jgi:hypothetical protein
MEHKKLSIRRRRIKRPFNLIFRETTCFALRKYYIYNPGGFRRGNDGIDRKHRNGESACHRRRRSEGGNAAEITSGGLSPLR